MKERKLVILGDGKIAADCIASVVARNSLDLVAYVHHRTNGWAVAKDKIPRQTQVLSCGNMNDASVLALLEQHAPDLVVNVNSFDILRDPILGIARDGAINFHNGPLPDYRGMNIPTWAIYNDETQHGVTWHKVVPAVDAGPILKQECFDVSPEETAITLIFKCLKAGHRLFEELMDEYARDGLPAGKAQGDQGRVYRGRDIPNDGYVDFGWKREELSRFARALTFRPFSEPALRPRFVVDGVLLHANTIEVSDPPERTAAAGTVIDVTGGGIVIASRDAVVGLFDLYDAHDRPVELGELSLEPGTTRAGGRS